MKDVLELTFSSLEFRQLRLYGFLKRPSLIFEKCAPVTCVFIGQALVTDSLLACQTENLSLFVLLLRTHMALLVFNQLFD